MIDTQHESKVTSKETVDQKIDKLAIAVKQGFDGVDKRFDGVDKRFDGVDKRFDGVDKRFDGVDKRFDGVDKRLSALEEKTTRIEATMVTKSYLDEKLFSLKGDLIGKMRKFEGGLLFLATVLRDRHVLSDEDVKRMRAEYQVFPSLDRT